MNNLWHLIKVQLANILSIHKIFHNKNKKEKMKNLFILMVILISFFTVVFISFAYSFLIATSVKHIGEYRLLPIIMFIATSFVTFLTTTYKTNGIIFGYKDYEMIMSLPINSSLVIASRVILLYLMNIAFTIIIIAPMGIVYAIHTSPDIRFYIIFIMALFFLPLIPIIIATVLGSIISFISSKFRYTNLISIILTILLIIGIIYLPNVINTSNINIESIEDMITKLLYSIHPMTKFYIEAICDYNIISLLIFIGISLTAFILFACLLSIKYNEINTALTSKSTNSNYVIRSLKQSSVFSCLYRKEIKRYFSSPLYVLNTGIGVVLLLLLSISLFIFPSTELDKMLKIPNFSKMLHQIAPLISASFIALSCTTSSSISLEGNNLWILKSAPIKTKEIFLSKIAINLTIGVPAIVISTVLFTLNLRLNLLESVLLLVTPICYNVFIAIIGLIINLLFPKLVWTNEAAVIKQSAASILAILMGMIVIAIPIVAVVYFTSISPTLILFITLVGIILLSILSYYYLLKVGDKQLYNLQ